MTPLSSSERKLLDLLIPATDHVEIPKRLHGAARKLWAHPRGHMVSLCHPPMDPGVLHVRLTGRGRALAELRGSAAS